MTDFSDITAFLVNPRPALQHNGFSEVTQGICANFVSPSDNAAVLVNSRSAL